MTNRVREFQRLLEGEGWTAEEAKQIAAEAEVRLSVEEMDQWIARMEQAAEKRREHEEQSHPLWNTTSAHEDERAVQEVEQVLLQMSDAEFEEFCKLQGIDDPKAYREFLSQDAPRLLKEIKKKEH